jgi:hypothetical protein
MITSLLFRLILRGLFRPIRIFITWIFAISFGLIGVNFISTFFIEFNQDC